MEKQCTLERLEVRTHYPCPQTKQVQVHDWLIPTAIINLF